MGDMADYYMEHEWDKMDQFLEIYLGHGIDPEEAVDYIESLITQYIHRTLKWTTQDKRQIIIQDLEERHLDNIIKILDNKLISTLAIDALLIVLRLEKAFRDRLKALENDQEGW